MTGTVSAGVRPPCLMVEPDCVVVGAGGRAGAGESERRTNLLLQLAGPPRHDVAGATVAAWLGVGTTGEVGVTGSLTAGPAVRVVGVGGAGLGGRTGQAGLVSPPTTDLLTSAHISVVLGLPTHCCLSLSQSQAGAADLSFARDDELSWVMQEVAVWYDAPDSFTHRYIVRGTGHRDRARLSRSYGKVFLIQGRNLL